MRYLILTASTGGGHNQAANNLKKEIEKNKDECIILDLLKKDKEKDTIIEKSYNLLINSIPESYGVIYKLSDNKLINNILLKNLFIDKSLYINKIIKEENIDVIISTHPFSVPIVTRLKEIFKIKLPFIQIVTDFKAHYSYVDKGVDAYITASEYTKEDMIKKGIDERKIHTYGIPIKEEFRNSSKIESDDFNVLIMGGALGLKQMEKAIEVLVKSNLLLKLTIVCGTNLKLKEKICEKYKEYIDNKTMTVYGFIDNINEIMENSKLIITKPGGLTTSETISKCIPMIIAYSLPGQEHENTNFLVESNVAIKIKNIKELPSYVEYLINNKEVYDLMVENMKKISKNYSTESIINLSKILKGEYVNEYNEIVNMIYDKEVKIEIIRSLSNVTDDMIQNHDELVILLEGQAKILIDGIEKELQKGDKLVIEKNVTHRVTYTSKDCKWLCVHLK